MFLTWAVLPGSTLHHSPCVAVLFLSRGTALQVQPERLETCDVLALRHGPPPKSQPATRSLLVLETLLVCGGSLIYQARGLPNPWFTKNGTLALCAQPTPLTKPLGSTPGDLHHNDFVDIFAEPPIRLVNQGPGKPTGDKLREW